jgi:predicted outer membrane protein
MTIVNLAEVQLGNTASEKTLNADVRAFGQMMAREHTQANSELKQIASQLHIQPPTQMDKKHSQLWSKLSELNGGDFDREYMNAMVMGHEEVLAKLRARADAGASGAQSSGSDDHGAAASARSSTASQSATPSQAGKGATAGHGDEALNQWAAKMIPAVQMHLDKAKEVQQKLGK